jgi:hypothetical protein
MSLPRAVTASASQTPPGAAPPSTPESPTPLLAPLPPLRLSTCQGTGHLLLAQPGPLLSLEGLSPQGAWGPISTHLTNYTLWERQSTVWVLPTVHPEHVLFFWLYLLEFSEMCF